MKKINALKQMPLDSFASIVFDIVKNTCQTVKDFEDFLDQEVSEEVETVIRKALQELQCPQHD